MYGMHICVEMHSFDLQNCSVSCVVMFRRQEQTTATFVTFCGILYSKNTGMIWRKLGMWKRYMQVISSWLVMCLQAAVMDD